MLLNQLYLYVRLFQVDFQSLVTKNIAFMELQNNSYCCLIQFIHKVLDGMCGRVPPSYTDYSKNWSLEEWWSVTDSCLAVITLIFRHAWSSQQVQFHLPLSDEMTSVTTLAGLCVYCLVPTVYTRV